jgi:hypothetical protein
VPLPNEEQGEAITFDPDGTLLSASEFGKATSSTITAVTGAAAMAAPPAPTTTVPPAAPANDTSAAPAVPAEDRPWWPVAGIGVVALVLIAAFVRRSRRA